MRRTLRVLSAFLLAAILTACAASFRTIGQHDPTVEAIKALTEVLKAKPTPSPSPTPEEVR